MRIILASKSPRRKELLSRIGIEHECIVSEAEEKTTESSPDKVVAELSRQKAENIFEIIRAGERDNSPMVIIGADTVVACDSNIMGKPKDKQDAGRMLKLLEGRNHSVWTGVTLLFVNIDKNGNYSENKVISETFACETKVYMYHVSDNEIEEYIKTEEPLDKAGAYGIQGIAAKFIEKIEGDYNNVVGLPVSALYQRIKNIL